MEFSELIRGDPAGSGSTRRSGRHLLISDVLEDWRQIEALRVAGDRGSKSAADESQTHDAERGPGH